MGTDCADFKPKIASHKIFKISYCKCISSAREMAQSPEISAITLCFIQIEVKEGKNRGRRFFDEQRWGVLTFF